MFWYTLIKTSIKKLIEYLKPNRKISAWEKEIVNKIMQEIDMNKLEWKWTVKFQRQNKIALDLISK